MKYVLIIGDGMGDEPLAELDGQTPLAAAHTPTFDRLARSGALMLVRTVPPGYPPGSDVANLSLLGYEPDRVYSGRAPLEAAAMGVELAGDELAFRCNLVTLDRRDGRVFMRDYSAGHISTTEARELILAVRDECGHDRFQLYPGVSYRHLLVAKGDAPGFETTPPHDHLDQDVTTWMEQYQRDEELWALLERAAGVLAQHPVNKKRRQQGQRPANAFWLWGEGQRPAMQPLSERFGISGGLVSAVDLLKGIGVCAGLEVATVDGATGTVDTNYQGKVDAALDILTRRDLVVVHLEGPDEAGHQASLEDKVRAIENLDQLITLPILGELEKRGEPFRLVVCMDHYTPIRLRTHVDWPVPLMLVDSRGCRAPSQMSYTEANAREAARRQGVSFDSGAAFFRAFVSGEL